MITQWRGKIEQKQMATYCPIKYYLPEKFSVVLRHNNFICVEGYMHIRQQNDYNGKGIK